MQKINKKIDIGSVQSKQSVYCQFGNYLIIVDNIYLYVLDLINQQLFVLTKLRPSYKDPKSVYISNCQEVCIAYDRFYTVFDTIEHTWTETSTNAQQKAQMFLASPTQYLQFPDTQQPQLILMRQRNNGQPTTVYENKISNFKNCRGFFQNNMMFTVDYSGNVRILSGKQISQICMNQDKFGHFRCQVQDEDEIMGTDADFEEKSMIVNNKKVIKLVRKGYSEKQTKKQKGVEPKESQRPKELVINDFSAQKAEKVLVKTETNEVSEDIIQSAKQDKKLKEALKTSKKYTSKPKKVASKYPDPTTDQNLEDFESKLPNIKPICVETIPDEDGKEQYIHLNEFLAYENDKNLIESDLNLIQDNYMEPPEELIHQEIKPLIEFPIIFPANTELEFGLEEQFQEFQNIQFETEHKEVLLNQEGQQIPSLKEFIGFSQQQDQINQDMGQLKMQRNVIILPEIRLAGGYVPTHENEFQPFDKRVIDYKIESPDIDKPPIQLVQPEHNDQKVESPKLPELVLMDLTLSKQKVGFNKPKVYSKPMLRTRGTGLNSNQKIGGGGQ